MRAYGGLDRRIDRRRQALCVGGEIVGAPVGAPVEDPDVTLPAELAASLGADTVVDYTREDFTRWRCATT